MTTPKFGKKIDRITIYHGSPASGIKRFESECDRFDRPGNDTLGTGTYFTDSETHATRYALLRSRQFGTDEPTVYVVMLRDVSIVDLREREIRIAALREFLVFLSKLLDAADGTAVNFGVHGQLARMHIESGRNMRERAGRIFRNMIDRNNPEPSNVRQILDSGYSIVPCYFSLYLKAFGNHGLISPEGTDWHEGGGDTWLVFEHYPNLRILEEKRLS